MEEEEQKRLLKSLDEIQQPVKTIEKTIQNLQKEITVWRQACEKLKKEIQPKVDELYAKIRSFVYARHVRHMCEDLLDKESNMQFYELGSLCLLGESRQASEELRNKWETDSGFIFRAVEVRFDKDRYHVYCPEQDRLLPLDEIDCLYLEEELQLQSTNRHLVLDNIDNNNNGDYTLPAYLLSHPSRHLV